MSLFNEMIVLIKKVQICGIRQAMQLIYSDKRQVSIHPLTSTDLHNVGLAIKNKWQIHTSLEIDDNDAKIRCT